MEDKMLNIKDTQPEKGDKILFLAPDSLVSGMQFKEVRNGKGIAYDPIDNKEEEFTWWEYKLEFNVERKTTSIRFDTLKGKWIEV